MQPFCNDNLYLSEVYDAHHHIKNAIKFASRDENKRYEHDTLFILLKEIQQIQRVGDLSAQHMLSILSLGDIIHPTFYVTKALLCPRNRTKSKFHSVYNINENTMNILYTEIANQYFDGSTAMVKNMGCEF